MNDTNLTNIIEIKPPLELDPGDGAGWAVWVLIALFLAGAALLCDSLYSLPFLLESNEVAQLLMASAFSAASARQVQSAGGRG